MTNKKKIKKSAMKFQQKANLTKVIKFKPISQSWQLNHKVRIRTKSDFQQLLRTNLANKINLNQTTTLTWE